MFLITPLQGILDRIAAEYGESRGYWTPLRVYSLLKILQQCHPESAELFINYCRSVCIYANFNYRSMIRVANGEILTKALFQALMVDSVRDRNWCILVNSKLEIAIVQMMNFVGSLQEQHRPLVYLKLNSYILGNGRGTNKCHKLEVRISICDLDSIGPVQSFCKKAAHSVFVDRRSQLQLAIDAATTLQGPQAEAVINELQKCYNELTLRQIQQEIHTAITTIGLNHGIPHLLSVCINGEAEIKLPSPLWDVVERAV
jgi:hypothetical protein